jgi:hypothetical protein
MEPIYAKSAARYARQGFLVYPLAQGARVPRKGSNGFYEATGDASLITKHAARHPNDNLAIRTGKKAGITIIDVDLKNGGFQTLAAYERNGKVLPLDAYYTTPSGGWHVVCQYHPLPTGAHRLGQGIDIVNDGAGTPVPPSTLADGRAYRWKAWSRDGLPPVPQWAIDHVQADRRAREAVLAEKARNTVRIDTSRLMDIERRRYEGLAASSLTRLSSRLVHQGRPGRGRELFTCCCFMAPYIRGGFIYEVTVRNAFENACRTNKLVDENGVVDVRRTMTVAFARSTDQLPDLSKLEDRPFRRAA